MGATPLIRPLRTQGGTVYVFQSAAIDISKTFSNDNTRFNFSKFACLKLPTRDKPSNNSNGIFYETLLPNNNELTDKSNIDLANSFQNYVLNHESVILSKQNSLGNDYNPNLVTTVCERLFWKWCNELGVIRFDSATSTDTSKTNLLVEEVESINGTKDDYTRVIKYLGDIDLINDVNKQGQAYTQIYLHIPTEHGSTPSILLKSVTDNNYSAGMFWQGTNDNIEGRTVGVDPNMSIKAYYSDNVNNKYINKATFGLSGSTIKSIYFTSDLTTTDVLIGNTDGVSIDWDATSYAKINNSVGISTISELNTIGEAQSFEFNTILIYYDIFDVTNPTVVNRNLYGVLFVDDFEEVNNSIDATLKSFTKFKPNPITKQNGNSYSLKLNVKFDTSADNVGVEKSINEYSTFSMDLFSDAMIQISDYVELFNSHTLKIEDLNSKVYNLEQFYFSQDTIDELTLKIDDLSTKCNNALISLESPSTLIELIRINSDRINKLAAGKLPLQVSYDLSPFRQGSGIKLDKSGNTIKVENTVQKFNYFSYCFNSSADLSFINGNGTTNVNDLLYNQANNILKLGEFTNYYKTSTTGSLTDNLTINIDDVTFKWKTGQVFYLYFNNEILINDYQILINTDSQNIFKNGSYKKQICNINKESLISNKPIIEIICKSSADYIFDFNIIR